MVQTLLIQDFLLDHTFQELEDAHGVCVRPDADFTKFSCNYDQIMARSGDPLAEQCRGLIIRPENGFWRRSGDDWKNVQVGATEVLAWPMCRFYNYGDVAAHPVNWADPDLRAYEKVDGTCIIVYWDPKKMTWCCATRSVSEADLPIHPGDLAIGDSTFADLFLRALTLTVEEKSGLPVSGIHSCVEVVQLDREVTYVFELVSPYNQIVVSYPEPRVYLLAARHLPSGKEIPLDQIGIENVRRPRIWNINDPVALATFVDASSPSELEGVVVCDSNFRRVKVKSRAYVLAHKSKDSVTASPRNALQAIILEKADDIIALIPKDVGDRMLRMQHSYGQYCKLVDANFKKFKADAEGSRKKFAELAIGSGGWSAPYFPLWEGRAQSAREWIRSLCETGKLADKTIDTIIQNMDAWNPIGMAHQFNGGPAVGCQGQAQ